MTHLRESEAVVQQLLDAMQSKRPNFPSGVEPILRMSMSA
jgi:hypothetical protein